MLRAVWSAKWYILLGLLAFSLITLATTPVHFVWRYVESAAKGLPFQIAQPTGTLWNGRVTLSTPGSGAIDTRWTLSPVALATGNVSLGLNADGENVRFEGAADVGGLFSGRPQHVVLTDIEGYVDSSVLRPFLMQAKTTLTGQFELSGLNADLSVADMKINDASGRVLYYGGQVNARVQRQTIATELPVLVADIDMQGERLVVPVKTADGDPLGEAFMQQDGWGGVTVLRRAVDIAGQQWPDKEATPDTVIFEVSQKFL